MATCPHCHHELPETFIESTPWKHTFSSVLASALRKFASGVGQKGINEIHLRHDLTGYLALTTDELNNFTKLRFHALVAKVRNADGSHRQGYWLLTRRGSRFLKGQEAIPRWVRTLNNRVTEHSVEQTTIADLPGLPPIHLSFEIADGNVLRLPPKQTKLNI